MKEFTIPMALVDYIPVIFFLFAAIKLQRLLYNKMSKGAFALFSAGTINVIVAGGAKATYKLLYAAGICDFQALTNIFFPIQALGFLLAGIAVIAMFVHNQGLNAVVPPLFSGTMVFVVMMVLGLGCMDAGLAILAKRLKKPGAIALLVVSFVFCLMMGYLSSRDFSQAYMNWVAQAINCVGQGSLLLAVNSLEKAGLEDLKIR